MPSKVLANVITTAAQELGIDPDRVMVANPAPYQLEISVQGSICNEDLVWLVERIQELAPPHMTIRMASIG